MAKCVLPDHELDKFHDYHLERNLTSAEPGSPTPQTIREVVLRGVRNLINRSTSDLNQELILITGHQNDGLSWACQQAADAVTHEHPTWKITPLVGDTEPGDLPEVVNDINDTGKKTMAKICRRLGLLPPSVPITRSRPGRFLLGAAFLTFVASLCSHILKAPAGVSSLWSFQGYELAMLGGAALFTSLAGYVMNQAKDRTQQETQQALATIFNQDIRTQSNLIRATAQAYVNLAIPRCILIDNFAALDAFTQETVKAALTETEPGVQGSCLWIVLETREYPLLERYISATPGVEKALQHRVSRFHLNLVSEVDRRSLASKLGWPETRATERPFLKHLARDLSDDERTELARIWTDFLRIDPEGRASIVDIVQLLASNSSYAEFALGWDDCVSLFSGERGLFRDLMRGEKGPLNRVEIREALHRLASEVPSFFLSPLRADEHIRIKPEVDDIVKPQQESALTQLHLFWLLHWSRRYQDKTPSFRFEKMLIAHLEQIKTLSHIFRGPHGAELVEEYLDILSQASADCLHMTLMREALQITDKLLAALQDFTDVEFADDRRLSRVWRRALVACWRVYVITRSEPILKRLFDLLADIAVRKEIAPLNHPDLDEALQYLKLMGITEKNGRLALAAKRQIGGADQMVFEKVLIYMQLAWVEFLYLFTRAFGTQTLSDCGVTPYREAATHVLQRIVWEEFDADTIHHQREFRTLNHEIITILHHTCARIGWYNDLLTMYLRVMSFHETFKQTQEQNQEQPRTETLLEKALQLDSLASCLDASLEVVRLRQDNDRHPSYYHALPHGDYAFRSDVFPGDLTATFNDMFEETFVNTLHETFHPHIGDGSPIPDPSFRRIEELYMRAALVWDRFGLDDLRNRTQNYRMDFVRRFSNAHPENQDTFKELVNGLSSALSAPTPVGLAAHLHLAAFFAPIEDLSTIYYLEVACRIWEQARSVPLMAAAAQAAIRHTIRPAAPHVAKLGNLFIGTLSDRRFQTQFANLADGRPLGNILDFLIQVAILLANDVLLDQACTLTETILHESLLRDKAIQHNVEMQLAIAAFDRRIKQNQFASANDALNEWNARFPDDSWTLSSIFLLLLASHTYRSADLYAHALAHLAVYPLPQWRRREMDLGVEVAHHFDAYPGSPELAQAISRLKEGVRMTEGTLSLELSRSILTLLIQHDPVEREGHSAHYARIAAIQLERQRAESLLYLTRQGHYFYTLEQYFRMLSPLALASVQDPSLPDALQNLNPQALLAAFHRHQERILTVVREVKNGKAVSRDYFAFGRKFFSESETVSQPEEFERIREMFNRVGRSQLSAFFDVALYHSDIPEYLKDILRRHRQLLSQA